MEEDEEMIVPNYEDQGNRQRTLSPGTVLN